jgi:protein-tyrosine phosphatase
MKAIVLSVILFLTALAAYPQIADSSRREIKLQGAINFRDIGGYATKDGRHVKWGKIYRSAELSHLTPADLTKLQQLPLAYVADFRGPYEVKAAPDKIPVTATRISLPAGSEHTGDSNYMKTLFKSAKGDSGLISFYSNITPFKDRYAPLFNELLQADKDSALLFHCTAGKDRTGIAAALILYALGVDEPTIIEDYVATNYYRRNENERAIKGVVQMYKIDEVTARNLMSAKEAYIRATFTTIKSQYGTMDIYLEQVMGLSKEKRGLLQQKYLE